MSEYKDKEWDMEDLDRASKLQTLGHTELDVYKLAHMLYNKRIGKMMDNG